MREKHEIEDDMEESLKGQPKEAVFPTILAGILEVLCDIRDILAGPSRYVMPKSGTKISDVAVEAMVRNQYTLSLIGNTIKTSESDAQKLSQIALLFTGEDYDIANNG